MTDWIDHARRWVPKDVRYGVQRFVSLAEAKRRWRLRSDPHAEVERGDDNRVGCPTRLGILRNHAQFHTHYIKGCQELGLPFRVFDLGRSDWLSDVQAAECGLFLAWPDATQSPWAKLYKDRCDVIESSLGIPVIPTSRERWLYEDKYRQREWLRVHGVDHPRTWVFADRAEALAFTSTCPLPLMFKTGFGGGAAGVQILRTRRALKSVVRRAFRAGHVAAGHDHRDREWGRVYLQEFIPDLREWRMVRIGDSYFGHPKGRLGEFHSGSGRAEWNAPDTRLLDLLHHITEIGGFRSMNVDVFETVDGRLLVNELQTVFGASTSVDQLRVDGVAGRMVRSASGEWSFERGDFARNACADARIRDALSQHFGFVVPDVHAAPGPEQNDVLPVAAQESGRR